MQAAAAAAVRAERQAAYGAPITNRSGVVHAAGNTKHLALFLALQQPLRLLLRNTLLLLFQLLPLHNRCALVLRHEHWFQHDAVVGLLLVLALLRPLAAVVFILFAAAETLLLLYHCSCSVTIRLAIAAKQ